MSNNISIYAKLEPQIKLKEMSIPDIESGTNNEDLEYEKGMLNFISSQKPSLMSHYKPIIIINDYKIQNDSIKNLTIDCESKIPTINFTFTDINKDFTTKNYPKDGDVVCLYIGAGDDEETFKPIRADFNIKNIYDLSYDLNKIYQIDGELNIDYIYNEKCAVYKDVTSYDALLKIASELNIGFASNIENTDDKQTWINSYKTSLRMIEDINDSSYKDDDSFFTYYIDLYYYLNYIECNAIFNDADNDSRDEKSAPLVNTTNTLYDIKAIKDYNVDVRESYYDYFYLTNDQRHAAKDNFISTFGVVSNANQVKDFIGYKTYVNYYDMNNEEYIQEFISPLTSEGSNLIPVNKPLNDLKEIDKDTRTLWLGIQSDNVHPNYKHSRINNRNNSYEFDKYGLDVTITSFNPRIIKMQKVYCKIYNTDLQERYKELTKEEQDLVIKTGDEFAYLIDKKLTGWYVVTGYKFKLINGVLSTNIKLRKRAIIDKD